MIETSLKYLKFLGVRHDDDGVDRMHYFVTSNMLIVLSLLISYKQFGSRPIECLTPKMFPKSYEDYAENYCWAQDTYIVTFDEKMPKVQQRYEEERRISYYQWVPFFLLFQALCFRLPSFLWKHLSTQSGIQLDELVKIAANERNIEPNVKQESLKSLSNHLENVLAFRRRAFRSFYRNHPPTSTLRLKSKSAKIALFPCLRTTMFTSFIYILIKLVYIFNVLTQLFFLNIFLETSKYDYYGFGVVWNIINGVNWEKSRMFPRVTLCDFKIRAMGNVQDYTVQCVLVINIFNEKIFMFLWFWYFMLLISAAVSLCYWLLIFAHPTTSRKFVARHLELSELPFDVKGNAQKLRVFVDEYLKADGVFILRMITNHAGIIFGTELCLALWQRYYSLIEQNEFPALTTAKSHQSDQNNNEAAEMDVEHNNDTDFHERSLTENLINDLKSYGDKDALLTRRSNTRPMSKLDDILIVQNNFDKKSHASV
uniref:Innexin n=1 Tax=Romanomermis culicivorax TaxID=13658 RepID=A0A915KVB9_ROMCU